MLELSVTTLPLEPYRYYLPDDIVCNLGVTKVGAGWGFICRTMAKYLFDLGIIEDSMQVTNMSGGGGGVAFAHVAKERNEDNKRI